MSNRKHFWMGIVWLISYMVFLDFFAHDLIVQGVWHPFSLATVWMVIASLSILRVGHHFDNTK